MKTKKKIIISSLYRKDEADALTLSELTERWRLETDKKKAELILKYANNARSLLDIGCGSGQILRQLAGKIPVLAGVDESPERLAQFRNNKLGIKTYQNNASALEIKDETFGIVLTSHIIHEIKLFETKKELMRTFAEIKRVLKSRGRYFIIDHLDPGESQVTIRLPDKHMKLLHRFVERFQYRKVNLIINGNNITLSKRDCQDFVTKIWSFGGGAEKLEMRETHTIMSRNALDQDLREAGFAIEEWIPFNSILDIMAYYSIELIKTDPWDRQFMLIAQKI